VVILGNFKETAIVTIVCIAAVILLLFAFDFLFGGRKKRSGDYKDTDGDKAPVKNENTESLSEETVDDELIAVISAAVAAAMGRPVSKIVVRSIRKLEPDTGSWAAAGRQTLMNSRF
jgi:Oxaloacetate decarboxylase, gamma chain.